MIASSQVPASDVAALVVSLISTGAIALLVTYTLARIAEWWMGL